MIETVGGKTASLHDIFDLTGQLRTGSTGRDQILVSYSKVINSNGLSAKSTYSEWSKFANKY